MKDDERYNDNINIGNAHLMFKNFSGEQGKYNAQGNRNFCVEIDPETADVLLADGWNVRTLAAKEPGYDDIKYLQVKVQYTEKSKPIIWLFTESDGKRIAQNKLTEENINMLDWAEIAKVDLVIRPYHYDVNGKKGIKGYLKSMYVTIKEDPFAGKYFDVPDSAYSSVTGSDID